MRRLVLLAFLVVPVLPVGASATCLSSGGVVVGGSCWFLSEFFESCDQVCMDVGLPYSEATRTFAGSDGTLNNCEEVMNALNVTWTVSISASCGAGSGCQATNDVPEPPYILIRCLAPATTNTATAEARRACACTVGAPAPTLSLPALGLLAGLLSGLGVLTLRRRSRV